MFILKHSVKVRRYLLYGCVAACHGMACVLFVCRMRLLLSELYIYQNARCNDKNSKSFL